MRKCYAVCDFLSSENKQRMREVTSGYGFDIDFFESDEEAHGRISDGEILYSSSAALLDEMPNLKWCHDAFAGAVPFAESGLFGEGKAILTNSSGAYGLAISEHVMMVTLMLMRRMPDYFEIIRRREWKEDLAIRSIECSTFAIIGTGDIGRNAAKRYKALGAKKVMGFSRSGRPAEGFDEIYRIDQYEEVIGGADPSGEIDVLLLCVPGTSESEGLLSKERIAMLPEKAFVINVGRGIVIDQDALMDALNEERIAGAALDVVYPEPLPADHPLWDAKNCIITPHISGDMGLQHTVDVTVDIFCENLKRYVNGEELTHVVNVQAGY